MPSDFLVDRRDDGRAITLTVTGELALLSSPALERALADSDGDPVIVDLRGVEFMDSTGLHVLIQAHQRMHEAGRRLAVVSAGPHVQRLFDLTGVSESLTIVDSPDAALATREGDLALKPEASRDRRAR
jgi:anti-anti-sigma factor